MIRRMKYLYSEKVYCSELGGFCNGCVGCYDCPYRNEDINSAEMLTI